MRLLFARTCSLGFLMLAACSGDPLGPRVPAVPAFEPPRPTGRAGYLLDVDLRTKGIAIAPSHELNHVWVMGPGEGEFLAMTVFEGSALVEGTGVSVPAGEPA